MLPDFLAFKRLAAQAVARQMSAPAGVASMIRTVMIHEGEGWQTVRADGSRDHQKPVRISVAVEFEADAIRRGDTSELRKALEKARQEMSRKQDEVFFNEVDRSVTNAVNAAGRPISAEIILEVLRTMDLAFNDDGSWDPPEVVGPNLELVRREWKRLEETPELRAQRDEIVEAGRKKWRDRESNRKLVD